MKWTTRRRLWLRITSTNRIRNFAVGTVKKSIETLFIIWLFKNVRHVWDAGLGFRRGIRLDTVRSEISIPSFSSSPWILGAPQSELAFAILRIRSRISGLTGGRPGPLRRDLILQNSLKPFLCQRTTVSGLTTIKACRQLLQKRERIIQKRRSLARSCGHLADRFIVASCWRSARFSKTISKVFLNPKRMLKSKFSVIFIMDEALAGLC